MKLSVFRTRSSQVLLLTAALLAGGLLLWSPWTTHHDPLERGRALYAAECASCHGPNLEGQIPDWRARLPNGRLPAPPHDASGHTWHHTDDQLFGIVKHGIGAFAPPGYESDMPGFGDHLSDAEIRDILAYIKSTWPDEIRARQEAVSRRSSS